MFYTMNVFCTFYRKKPVEKVGQEAEVVPPLGTDALPHPIWYVQLL